jgi:Putative restriction endonuclease
MSEYAEAGIPHYWLVDLPPRLQLTAYTLVSGRYEQRAIGTDVIDIDLPSPVRLDLKSLLTRRSHSRRRSSPTRRDISSRSAGFLASSRARCAAVSASAGRSSVASRSARAACHRW